MKEQREQSQTRMKPAESRVKKSKAQYIQANKDWLVAKSKEEGVRALPKGIYYNTGRGSLGRRTLARQECFECPADGSQHHYCSLYWQDY